MRIGSSTLYGINNKTVLESVNELKTKGFDTIELVYEYNNLITEKEAQELRKEKLSFSMHCPFIGVMFTHLNKDFSAPQVKLIEESLKIAKIIGCTHYVMHGGAIPGSYSAIENSKSRDYFLELFIKRFKKIFKKYSECGIKILMENLTGGQIGGLVSDITHIQREIPETGFCFDIAHAEITKQTDEIFNTLKIDYVHSTDNDQIKDDHNVVGKGKINYPDFIKRLKDKGFKGKIILENLSFPECIESRDNLKKIIKA